MLCLGWRRCIFGLLTLLQKLRKMSKKKQKVWRAEYRARFPKGDKLAKVGRLIDWEAFRPILEPLFKNNREGRPHEDVILMTKVLVLQSWYGLSDEAIETECMDRLTFQNFLGYPEKVPDQNTVWLFRERLAKEGGKKQEEFWEELQRQLKKYRVRVKKGKMDDVVFVELGAWRAEGLEGPVVPFAPHTGFAQDSTMIEADAGLPTEEDVKRREEAKKKKKEEQQPEAAAARENPEAAAANSSSPPPAATDSAVMKKEAQNHEEKTAADGSVQQETRKDTSAARASPVITTSAASVPAATASKIETKPRGVEAFTRRSKDGTWTKKHGRSYFGYKLHTKNDLSTGYISSLEVTTASVNDNSIDLTKKGEPCVRDRGYTDPGRGLCLSMMRAKAGQPLPEKDKEMNRFISKIRGPVEHPYAVIKRVFRGGRIFVTTIDRVKVKETFVCMCYNLFRALTLSRMK